MRTSLIVALLFVLMVSIVQGQDSFDTTVSTVSCGDEIVEDTVLENDLTNCEGHGLVIKSGSITLDCNGHAISGVLNTDTYGLYLYYKSDVTIKNCNINNFFHGVYIKRGAINNLINNTISANDQQGIALVENTARNTVLENSIFNNGHSGVWIYGSSDENVISRSYIYDNSYYGINLDGSSLNSIRGNIFWDHPRGNSYENSNNNSWNNSLMGNHWDDFESNPGYPNYYEIPGPGNGIDWQPLTVLDTDGDRIFDGIDNCVFVSNAYQRDFDEDDVGDWCDNCPLTFNPGQEDDNFNQLGNACEDSRYMCKEIRLREVSLDDLTTCGGNIPCTCGDTLVRHTVLTNDLLNCSGDYGLRFKEGKEISLDCNEHTIRGVGKSGSTGIYLPNGTYTITNCLIENFEDGVFMGEGWMTLSNNLITNNVGNGIFIDSILRKYIQYNNITKNGNGIYVIDSTPFAYSNGIHHNKIYNNWEDGIYVQESSWLKVYNNSITTNGKYGMETVNPEFTFVQANIFENNVMGNAFEYNGSQTNTWNMSELGNYWDDFESNPGYPNYYEIAGPGNGVDWYPNKI